ncbi:hypothetical protein HDU67_000951, partial [Dinochytrium kinnereticum]
MEIFPNYTPERSEETFYFPASLKHKPARRPPRYIYLWCQLTVKGLFSNSSLTGYHTNLRLISAVTAERQIALHPSVFSISDVEFAGIPLSDQFLERASSFSVTIPRDLDRPLKLIFPSPFPQLSPSASTAASPVSSDFTEDSVAARLLSPRVEPRQIDPIRSEAPAFSTDSEQEEELPLLTRRLGVAGTSSTVLPPLATPTVVPEEVLLTPALSGSLASHATDPLATSAAFSRPELTSSRPLVRFSHASTAPTPPPPITLTAMSGTTGAGGSSGFSRSSSSASIAAGGKILDGMDAKSAKIDMSTVTLTTTQPASVYRFISKIEDTLRPYVQDPAKPDLVRPFTDLDHAFRVTWNPNVNLKTPADSIAHLCEKGSVTFAELKTILLQNFAPDMDEKTLQTQ